MRTIYAYPGQAWDATTTCGAEGGLTSLMSGGGWAAVTSSVLLTAAVTLSPLASAFCWHRFQTSAWQKTAIRINHVTTHTSRTMPMSHSYRHRVSLCFQKPRCCAKIFRNLSLLIGISKDTFAHWPSIDINGVTIPSVIVGDSAYPYWLFLLKPFARYFEKGLV